MKKKIIAMPAPIWKRIAAFIIDLLVIDFIIVSFFQKHLKISDPIKSFDHLMLIISSNSGLQTKLAIVVFSISIAAILYFAILEYKVGQTVGKMILNIYVICPVKMSFLSALVRNLYVLPFFPFFLLWVIDPLYIMFNPQKQRLTEVLTKTMVVVQIDR